jgi:hypothetical protein
MLERHADDKYSNLLVQFVDKEEYEVLWIKPIGWHHRHLRKIDWLMACTTCLVCLISTVCGHIKKNVG